MFSVVVSLYYSPVGVRGSANFLVTHIIMLNCREQMRIPPSRESPAPESIRHVLWPSLLVQQPNVVDDLAIPFLALDLT